MAVTTSSNFSLKNPEQSHLNTPVETLSKERINEIGAYVLNSGDPNASKQHYPLLSRVSDLSEYISSGLKPYKNHLKKPPFRRETLQLLEKGRFDEAVYKLKDSPIKQAVLLGDLKYLESHISDLKEATTNDNDILELAIHSGNLEVVKMVVGENLPLLKKGRPLAAVAQVKNSDIAKYILDLIFKNREHFEVGEILLDGCVYIFEEYPQKEEAWNRKFLEMTFPPMLRYLRNTYLFQDYDFKCYWSLCLMAVGCPELAFNHLVKGKSPFAFSLTVEDVFCPDFPKLLESKDVHLKKMARMAVAICENKTTIRIAAISDHAEYVVKAALCSGKMSSFQVLLEFMKDDRMFPFYFFEAINFHPRALKFALDYCKEMRDDSILKLKDGAGQTFLHKDIRRSKAHLRLVVEYCKEVGDDSLLKAQDKEGKTFLHCKAGNEAIVRLAVEYCKEVGDDSLLKARDKEGKTFLHCKAGNKAIVRLAVEYCKEVGDDSLLKAQDKEGKTFLNQPDNKEEFLQKHISSPISKDLSHRKPLIEPAKRRSWLNCAAVSGASLFVLMAVIISLYAAYRYKID